jgi:hypothetical protein
MVEVIVYSAVWGTDHTQHIYNADNGLINVKLSSQKSAILNDMMNEAQRAIIELVIDDWLFNLQDAHITNEGISYYDAIVRNDGNEIFHGVIPASNICPDSTSGCITITAYSYEHLFKKLDSSQAYIPIFSNELFLTKFRELIRAKFMRGEILEYPEYLTGYRSENVKLYDKFVQESNSLIDEGLLVKTLNVYNENYTEVVDSYDVYEYRSVVWRWVNHFTTSMKWQLTKTTCVVKIYNKICIEVVVNDGGTLDGIYNSISDAQDAIPGLKSDIDYYDDDTWIGVTSLGGYSIQGHDLYYDGNIYPYKAVYANGTSYLDMLKGHFLIYQLATKMNSDCSVSVVHASLSGDTGLNITDRVTDFKGAPFSSPIINLDVLDSLLGDSELLKSYVLERYSSYYSALKQFTATIDDIESDDIKLNDEVIIYDENYDKTYNLRVVEVQPELSNDGYKLTLWG